MRRIRKLRWELVKGTHRNRVTVRLIYGNNKPKKIYLQWANQHSDWFTLAYFWSSLMRYRGYGDQESWHGIGEIIYFLDGKYVMTPSKSLALRRSMLGEPPP